MPRAVVLFGVGVLACGPSGTDGSSMPQGPATSGGVGGATAITSGANPGGASRGEGGVTSTGTTPGGGASSGGASSMGGIPSSVAGTSAMGGSATSVAGASGAAASGMAGSSGAAGAVSSLACPELEGRPPLPVVGPWLFGPHPGPCEYHSGEDGIEYDHTTFSYDPDGRATTGQHASGAVTGFIYDESGRVIQFGMDIEVDPWNVMYEGSRVAWVERGMSQVTFGYDDGGRIVSADYVVDGVVQIERNYYWESCRIVRREEDGWLKEEVPPDGTIDAIFDYTYDAEGHLVSILERDGFLAYDTFDYSCW